MLGFGWQHLVEASPADQGARKHSIAPVHHTE